MSIFDKLVNLKDKFARFLGHKKKMKALENLSSIQPFEAPLQKRFNLLKECMEDGFLEDPADDFLSYMVDKYFKEESFLDWAYRTRWLKEEMERRSPPVVKASGFQMDLFLAEREKITPVHIPIELLSASSGNRLMSKGA
jgi:hypothetical protein